MTLQKAIEGCKRQDRISQKYIFDIYADGMLLLCMRYVKSLPDAEELMLNGFFNFYKSIDRFVFTDKNGLSAWLKRIMVNECLGFLRKSGELKIAAEQDYDDVPAADDVIAAINAAEIFKLITALPAGYRTIFNLFVVEGYSHKEIAGIMNIAEGTSKSQLNKAKSMLQQQITQREFL